MPKVFNPFSPRVLDWSKPAILTGQGIDVDDDTAAALVAQGWLLDDPAKTPDPDPEPQVATKSSSKSRVFEPAPDNDVPAPPVTDEPKEG